MGRVIGSLACLPGEAVASRLLALLGNKQEANKPTPTELKLVCVMPCVFKTHTHTRHASLFLTPPKKHAEWTLDSRFRSTHHHHHHYPPIAPSTTGRQGDRPTDRLLLPASSTPPPDKTRPFTRRRRMAHRTITPLLALLLLAATTLAFPKEPRVIEPKYVRACVRASSSHHVWGLGGALTS